MNDQACHVHPFNRIYLLTEWQTMLVACLVSVVLVSNMVWNSFVVYILVGKRLLKNMSMRLILTLSAFDLLSCVTAQAMLVVALVRYPRSAHCRLELALVYTNTFIGHVSAFVIALISVDRFLRIFYLNNYSSVVSITRQRCALASAVILAAIFGLQYVLPVSRRAFTAVKMTIFSLDVVIAVAVTVLYVSSLCIVKSYQNQSKNREFMRKTNRKLNAVTSRILLALVLAYMPFVFATICYAVMFEQASESTQQYLVFAMLLCYVVIFSNSSANALIFLKSCTEARNALMGVLNNACFIRHCRPPTNMRVVSFKNK